MNRLGLRGESIYSVFIRNFTDKGNIQGVIDKLDYIKDIGVTILWILPHYPIGKVNRKGVDGSPYSIKNYKEVNPDLGSLDDFKNLVKSCHDKGLKLMIDVVFNHSSCDSNILNSNPQWFLSNHNGLISKIPQWTDVYDLNFDNNDLWDYLIEVLKFWSNLGIDGFRCDVASVVPLDFWIRAKKEIEDINEDTIWLAESVDKEFISFIRHQGFPCHSDSELYNAFHILYDYDIQSFIEGYIEGNVDFQTFTRELRNQEVVYPQDYLKLRFLENHDSKHRIAKKVKDNNKLKNWKAFSVYQKGIPLIYNGEEVQLKNHIDLFNIDKINWNEANSSYLDFIKTLLSITKKDIVKKGIYTINPLIEDCFHLRYRHKGKTLHGIFNFGRKNRYIPIESLEGDYINQINQQSIKITSKGLKLDQAPYIFESIP